MNRPHEPARSHAKVLRPGAKWLCVPQQPLPANSRRPW